MFPFHIIGARAYSLDRGNALSARDVLTLAIGVASPGFFGWYSPPHLRFLARNSPIMRNLTDCFAGFILTAAERRNAPPRLVKNKVGRRWMAAAATETFSHKFSLLISSPLAKKNSGDRAGRR